ncbi:helix-turn-helix transcriptional regulator [Kitasatospora purpeofusca]|uniref:helix-turn-helix domain-containing protein n=1 Tax=Kitasatospora purpeofusca TaxID=67352 RepID=UPI002A5AAF86|nr:helix-turn-helix transcriptional regulator [Kitasatospora purpeofusca]MDY0810505.1 helix-turn-helix transcriptional regulator [Kitasatospora purpeofusca]
MTAATVRRRQLGSQLRAIREQRGLKLEEVEQRTGITSAKLSRIELAKSAAKPADVDTLARMYECDDQLRESLVRVARDGNKRGWWLNYGEALAPWLSDQISLEEAATTFRTYQVQLIPGLFQTAGYARAVHARLAIGATPEDLEARVRVRRERQAILTQPKPLEMQAVIHEAAIRSLVGGAQTMREQLEKLLELAALPNITIQVMPSETGVHQGMNGPFAILGFPDSDLDVVLLEGLLTSEWVEDAERVTVFDRAFRGIVAEAWSLDQSIDFVTAQKDRLK